MKLLLPFIFFMNINEIIQTFAYLFKNGFNNGEDGSTVEIFSACNEPENNKQVTVIFAHNAVKIQNV